MRVLAASACAGSLLALEGALFDVVRHGGDLFEGRGTLGQGLERFGGLRVGDDGLVDLPIDPLQAFGRDLLRQPAVDEDDPVDFDDGGPGQGPGAVRAVEVEHPEISEKAGGIAVIEGGPQLGIAGPVRRIGRDVACPGLFPVLRLLVRGEGGVALFVDVAEVPHQDHEVVIAQERMDLAAGRFRFGLKAHDQVHDLAVVLAAVDQVADERQMGRPARPLQAPVDQARAAQQRDELVVGGVDVADGHDPVHPGPLPLGDLGGPAGRYSGQKSQAQDPGQEDIPSPYLHVHVPLSAQPTGYSGRDGATLPARGELGPILMLFPFPWQ